MKLEIAITGAIALGCWALIGGPDGLADETAVNDRGAQPAADAWPQWLGPDRTGVVDAKDWSTEWPEDGLPILWKRQIGIGFSSCSYMDGLLYTMGNVDGKEHVWCLDAKTGEEVWKHTYECQLVDNLYEGGPGATPTLEGERLYTVGKEGQLMCLQRRTGKVLWETSLQTEFDVELHEWGFNASPLIHGNHLLVQGGRLASFDKRSGKKLWQTEPHTAGYGSATVFRSGDELLVAALDCDGLRIVQLADGKERGFVEWRSPFRTNSTTPIVRDNLVYISTGYNVGCGLFRWTGEKLEEVYANRDMRNHFNNSILLGGYLYGFDGNSNFGRVVHLTCMEFGTGKMMWQERGFGCGSLIVADGKLLILSDSGDLVLGAADPEGFREIARSPLLSGRCWTTPILVSGKVFARNAEGELVCAALPARDEE